MEVLGMTEQNDDSTTVMWSIFPFILLVFVSVPFLCSCILM